MTVIDVKCRHCHCSERAHEGSGLAEMDIERGVEAQAGLCCVCIVAWDRRRWDIGTMVSWTRGRA